MVDLSQMGQIWLSTHGEKDALSSKLKYQSDKFYDSFLFMASIWTYFMYLCLQGDVISFIAIETHFLGRKVFWKRSLKVKF